MSPVELLLQLQANDIRVWVDGGQLVVSSDAPVPADLQAEIDAQRDALVQFLQEATAAAAPAEAEPGIPTVDRAGPLPLSFAQQRFWFLLQIEPDSSAFNLLYVVRLRGEIDAGLLESSLHEIVQRHEILRTTFATAGDEPVQIVHDDVPVTLAQADVRGEADPEAAAARMAADEIARPFDAATGPLFRFTLVRVADGEHRLLISLLHMVADGWSFGVLFQELTKLYAAKVAGTDPDLPALPVQYADYAAWQQDWYAQESSRLAGFWRERLKDLPTVDLPTDRPRPATQTFAGGRRFFALPDGTRDQLDALGKAEGCTYFMTMLSAFQVLLARITGQDDLVVGTPVANRDRAETEPLIGLFLNTLVLRGRIPEGARFRDVMRQVQQDTLSAFQHQEMPFEQLVAELKPERDVSRNPLFQILFNVLYEAPPPRIEGIDADFLEPDSVTSMFDLSLTLTSLGGWFEYNVDLFDAETVDRFASRLHKLLAAVIADPDVRVHEVDLRTDEERAVVEAVNDTARDYPRDQTFPQRFEAQVAESPDRTAVTCGGESLTYAELNARANRFAHLLRDRGARPDQLIGVALPRGLDLLVALLGIQKAGAAYVPLDPEYPEDRIAFIVEDARIQLMVRPDDFDVGDGVVRVGDAAEQSDQNPEPAAGPSHLAYVIFTSGSTGKPKGVQIEHRALLNFLETMADRPGLTQDDVLCAVTTISFDIAGLELYLPLLKGARIALATEDQVSDGRALAQLLSDESCTLLQATPATWRLLLEVGFERKNLKALCGGEALPRELAEQLLPVVGELWNMYGPTETTVWSLVQKMESGDGFVPIGAPIANTQVHLLDRQLQPVPIGVPGELYLGGDGLARGYWNRDELTAEKFIAHPFSSDSGARLYHTGDLARWHPDGSLEFLGRIDHQVKVRGFRIELGEIEHVLADHEAVKDCAVVAQRLPTGDQLVAHVITESGEPADVGDLRSWLGRSLPDYMVPAGFVTHASLPLTPNGKVDRKALTQHQHTVTATAEYVEPVTETQRFLAESWREILAVDRVGLRDNFFDLGGHSLLAMKVIFAVEKQFGLRLSPMELLTQDLEGFAAACDPDSGTSTLASITIEPVARDGDLSPSFGQQRFWFLSQLESDESAYNVPMPLRLTGPLDVEALRSALTDVVARHESLRTTFDGVEGQPIVRIAEPSAVDLDLVDVSTGTDPEAATRELVQNAARQSFDLTRGPVYRFTLIRRGAEDHVLIATMHHVVADEWSLGVLCHDLVLIYNAKLSGRPAELPELTIQYPDYAAWQRQWYETEGPAHVTYWQDKLDAAPALELPTDRPRPTQQTFVGRTLEFSISKGTADAMRALGRAEGGTFFMAMLAAFKILVARQAQQSDIVLGTPIANRGSAQAEPLIGLFLNTLILRTDLEGTSSFRDVLRAVRQTTLDAFEHQGVPFDQLVQELPLERDLSRNPVFQVLFQLNDDWPEFSLGEAAITPYELENVTSKFDLTLALTDSADELRGRLEYNTDLFDPATIEGLRDRFALLLDAIVTNPSADLWTLPLLTRAEKAIIDRVNDTARDYPHDQTFPQRFEAQVAESPDRTAVTCGGESLTYAELNARANRFAHLLRDRGARPDQLIGVALPRGLDLLVALLGIQKAGAAYVPLDPEYPEDRIAFIVEDAGIQLMVRPDDFDVVDGVVRVGDAADRSDQNPEPAAGPSHLAYVIFTSGSTGKPKGVQIEHRALLNFLETMADRPGLTQDDVLCAVTTISFDIAGLELYLPLLKGARIALATEDQVSDGRALAQLLSDESCTLLQATPATWRLLLEVGFERKNLKALCGGEALPRELAEQLLPVIGELWNMYGPTETTVWSLVQKMESGDGFVPIGAPIANTQVHLLDRQLQPVPIGVPGELYLGGDGLARGYWNRDELTAEKFLAHPFSNEPGARLYHTGDLARWHPDGSLEFLGRIDHQVKVRGFRIELGEIEHVLADHEAVKDCAVVAQRLPTGDQLVAHIITESGEPADVGDLRSWLGRSLPDYMVPAGFVTHEALPLTPNGKVDRKALAQHQHTVTAAAEYVEPATETQKHVAGIWREILVADRVGLRDNFFDLGGHSLLAMKVIFAVEKQFGLRLSPMELLTQDLEGFASACEPETGAPSLPPITIEPVARDGHLAPSFGQQRFWFLSQLEADESAYNVPMPLRLTGPLDVPALTWALTHVVGRHESLRTTFDSVEGQPVLRVAELADVELTQVDVSSDPDVEARTRELTQQDATRAFDLAVGPVYRFTLIRRGDHDHVLLITMHHVVSDEWSLGLLCHDLVLSYRARLAGEAPDLPELSIQYPDYAAWQRQWYETEGPAHVAYWQDKLGGAPTLELPTDRARPMAQTFGGRTLEFTIPKATADAMRALGRAEHGTFFMAMLAAFKVLMARYARQQDVVIGTPVANRGSAQAEPLIGLFLNTLVLRTDLGPATTFRDVIRAVRETTLEAFEHQGVPFEQLVQELPLERDLSRNPVFQVLFQLNEDWPDLQLGDARITPYELENVTSKFDLTLALTDGADGLRARLEYNTDLFDPATIENLRDHLHVVLDAVTTNPSVDIWTLPLLTRAEQAIIDRVNDTARDYPRDQTFPQRFEAQVAESPDRTAVTCGGESLTYAELNARANRFAHLLRDRGARPDQLIGVALPRGLDLLVALLGIQKAGAAYVPLDPEYPEDRIAFIVEDAGIQLMVRPDDFDVVDGVVRVGDAADRSDQNPEPAAGPSHLAYVIFTSGSTGKPKGVQIEHRALLNFLETMADRPGLTQDDVLCAVTTISFDIAGLELYLPLLKGARIALATEDQVSDGRALAQLLSDESCTLLQATPATWRLLLEVGFERKNLKALCGGEALPRELAEQLLPVVGELWNMYGPTETTVWSLVQKMESGDGFVPIGAPIANTQVHLLDRQLQPVPIGVPGELYLGGDGLARGYWNRDELTAEKFIAHPFSSDSGARLYHTGDLARWHPDGSLEFLGRIDHQVKVRGFRIELGEIEHVLADHEAVKLCAVVAQRKPTGDQLSAHVVLHPGANATVSELRKHLRASLPDYMVPQGFLMVDELPLTPNGKIDRKVLASIDARGAGEKFVAPRTEMEVFMAETWSDILGIEKIGLHDNFFDLGGHSLLAMKVVYRVEQRIGERVLPMELMLQDLRQFAEMCEKRGGQRSPAPAASKDTATTTAPREDQGGGLFGRLKRKLGRSKTK